MTTTMTTTLWRHHRDTVLQTVSLDTLINSASKLCPHPRHRSDHDSPTIVTYETAERIQRWLCTQCGAGGTAIEWVTHTNSVPAYDAFEQLQTLGTAEPRSPMTNRLQCLDQYIADTTQLLWTNQGQQARNWLNEHGLLHEPTLRANHVGYDPGPHLQPRSVGLPSNGPSIVFPITATPDTAPTTVHVRSLQHDPNHPRWIAPAINLATTPQLAFFAPSPGSDKELLVCTNVTDALTATTLRHRACALLSGNELRPNAIDQLRALSPTYQLRICFPNTPPDQQRAATLCALLDDIQPSTLLLPDDAPDLNHWHRTNRAKTR